MDFNKVSHLLIDKGVKEEDVILILLPRGVDSYISNLGVLKAGAAYVMGSLAYPDDRIRFVSEDANVKCIITDESTFDSRKEQLSAILQTFIRNSV